MSAFLRRSMALTAGLASELARYVNFPRLLQISQARMIQRNRVERGNLLIAPPCGRSAHSDCGACSRDLQPVYIGIQRCALPEVIGTCVGLPREFWWLFAEALVNLGVLCVFVVKFLKASPPRHQGRQEHKADWLRLTDRHSQ